MTLGAVKSCKLIQTSCLTGLDTNKFCTNFTQFMQSYLMNPIQPNRRFCDACLTKSMNILMAKAMICQRVLAIGGRIDVQ